MLKISICPFCNGEKFKLTRNNVNSIYLNKKSNVFTCVECKTSFTNPILNKEDVDEIYLNKYPYEFYNFVKQEKIARAEILFKWLNKKIKISSLFEIGCMHGDILDIFLRKGIPAAGADLINTKKNYIKQMDAMNFSATKMDVYFDTLLMVHTFEHLKEPKIFLKNIQFYHPQIKFIIVVVPNFNSLLSKIFKNKWGSLQLGPHYFHFTKKTLNNHFNSINFKLLDQRTVGGDFNLLASTFINIFKPNIEIKKTKLNKLTINIIKIVGIILTKLIYFGNEEIWSIYKRI